MKRFLGILLFAAVTTTAAHAQGGTNSPYSQYGFGELSQLGTGASRGMNGLGYGIHRGNQVNTMNPASYGYTDSLTFMFDVGLSGQLTNFNENGTKLNVYNADFEYAVGSFRAAKNFGISFGIVPMTNVGYKYSTSTTLKEASTTIASSYSGEGGLNKLFVGAGWHLMKPLSVGFNAGYLWADLDRTVITASSSSSNNTLAKYYKADISSYTLDFGLQFDQPIGKEDRLTLGVTYGLGHKLGSDAECLIVNAKTGGADTTQFVVGDAFELPHTLGAGFSYTHGQQWLVGADVETQRWGKVDFPDYQGGTYALRSGLLKNSYRATIGGEWTPRWNSPKLYHRIRYRAGVGYATPYYYINGKEGPKQFSATIGFGIPIQNTWNNRSFVNISAQYVRQEAAGFIKENTFRLNIGITFNERWFAKWKVE